MDVKSIAEKIVFLCYPVGGGYNVSNKKEEVEKILEEFKDIIKNDHLKEIELSYVSGNNEEIEFAKHQSHSDGATKLNREELNAAIATMSARKTYHVENCW